MALICPALVSPLPRVRRVDAHLVKREMDTLFATILDDGHDLVGAQTCSMFFVDEDKGELWSKVATDNRGEIKVGRGRLCACHVDIRTHS